MIFVQIAIKPGLQHDNTVSIVIINLWNKKKSENAATHALFYMLGGVLTRWKQIVGYDFTGSSFGPEDVFSTLTEIIQRTHHIGVTIQAVISDMGSQNHSLWKMLHIVAGQHYAIKNSIKKYYGCLTKGYKFILSDSIVQKYGLPFKEVLIEPIRQLHVLDKNDVLKI